jgi:hypothetical protein
MQPHLYSAICKARMLYSRRVAGAEMRRLFRRNQRLFAMNEAETRQVNSLREFGYALISEFFPRKLIDRIFSRADAMFHNLEIDSHLAYSIQFKERSTLEGLCYSELAATEKMIALRDPLIRIPETLDVAFHESILKIAGNFLGYVPPLYHVTVVRDFPHNRPLHSSNFHKDNDESDSLQIFIYLVDVDDTCGPLVYIPGSNHYDVRSCRPRLSRDLGIPANDGRADTDVSLARCAAYGLDRFRIARRGNRARRNHPPEPVFVSSIRGRSAVFDRRGICSDSVPEDTRSLLRIPWNPHEFSQCG